MNQKETIQVKKKIEKKKKKRKIEKKKKRFAFPIQSGVRFNVSRPR